MINAQYFIVKISSVNYNFFNSYVEFLQYFLYYTIMRLNLKYKILFEKFDLNNWKILFITKVNNNTSRLNRDFIIK